MDHLAIIDGLQALVEASLLRVSSSAAGELRFSMLETIREYALERLDANHERQDSQAAHANYYATLALALAQIHSGVPHPEWMRRLNAEHNNFRAALVWSRDNDKPLIVIEIAWTLWRYWNVQGFISEGRSWLREALLQHEGFELDPSVRGDLLLGAGELAKRQRDYQHAVNAFQQAEHVFTELGDECGQAHAYLGLGSVAYDRGDLETAAGHDKAAEVIFRRLGDEGKVAATQAFLGGIAVDLGQYEEAHNALDPALKVLRRLGKDGDEAALVSCLESLARLAHAEGDLDLAARLMDDIQALQEPLGDVRGATIKLLERARIAHQSGDQLQARWLRESALEHAKRIGDPVGVALAHADQARFDADRPRSERTRLLMDSLNTFIRLRDHLHAAEALEGLAFLHLQDRPRETVVLYSAADLARNASMVALHHSDAERQRERVDVLRKVLGESRFDEAWSIGQELGTKVIAGDFPAELN